MADEVVRLVFEGDVSDLDAAMEAIQASAQDAGVALERDIGTKGTAGLNKAEKSSKQLAKGLKLVGAAVGIMTAAVTAMVVSTVSLAESLNIVAKEASAAGSTAEEIQKLDGALALLTKGGGSAAETAKFLQRNLADVADGTGAAGDALTKLGLDAEELARLPLTEQLRQIADSMPNLATQAERTQVSMALLGRSGADLVPAFAGGSKALDEAIGLIEDAGIASNESAVEAEALVDAVELMNRSLATLTREILGPLIPELTSLATVIAQTAQAALKDEGFRRMAATLADVTAGALRATAAFVRLDLEIGKSEGEQLGKQIGDLNGKLKTLDDLLFDSADLTKENAGEWLSATASLGAFGTITERVSELLKLQAAAQSELQEVEGKSLARSQEIIAAKRLEAEAERELLRTRKELAGGGGGGSGGGGGGGKKTGADGGGGGGGDLFDKIADHVAATIEQLQEFADESERIAGEVAANVEGIVLSIVSSVGSLASQLLSTMLGQVRETKDEIVQLEQDITRATSTQEKARLRGLKAAKSKELEEHKKAALAAFVIQKSSAVASTIIATAVGIANALSQFPGPSGIAFAVGMAVAGGIATAAIIAQPPPSFHSGGIVDARRLVADTPDSRMTRLRDGEGVLSNQGVSNAGGRQGVDALNRGQGVGGTTVNAFVVFDDGTTDKLDSSAQARTGSPANRAMSPTVGRHNPWARAS